MKFFYDNDWLNRGLESYAFQWDHLVFIAIAMIIGVVVAILLRKTSHKTVKIVLISLWAFYVTIEVIHYIIIYTEAAINPTEHPFNIETMLPLHSCLMLMYVFPVAMFCKNKIIKTAACNFLVVVNMIMGFITLFVGCPPGGYAALSYFGVDTLTYHSIDVIIPLIMVVTNFYDLQKKDILYGLAAFAAIATVIYIFDAITGCDYFYFYDGHVFPAFKFISEAVPHHSLWSLLIISCYGITAVSVHFLIFGIKYLINKKKSETKENLQ